MIITFDYINDEFRPYIWNNFFGSRILSFQFAENNSNRLIFQSVPKNPRIILFPRIASIVVIFVQRDLLASFFVTFPPHSRLLPNHFLRPKFEA